MGDNTGLRALICESGYTHDAVAKAVNRIGAENGHLLRYTKSSVSQWLSGVHRPQPATVGYLAEALARRLGRAVHPIEIGFTSTDDTLDRLPDDPIAALRRLGRADVDRRGFLASAAYSLSALMLSNEYAQEQDARAATAAKGKPIGVAEVEAVAEITKAFDMADERLGGGFGRSALVEYLTTDVTAYCRAPAAQAVRGAIFNQAMQLAYLAAWKCHDLMQEGLAQRYYLYAYQLAAYSNDPRQAAYVKRILAHQAFDLGHYVNCLDLAVSATEAIRGQADPHTQAVFVLTVARAHAMRGEKRQALEAISVAEKLNERAGQGDTRPGWVKLRNNAGQYHSHVAKALADLGDLDGAQEHFALSFGARGFTEDHALIVGLSQGWLAEVAFKAGRLDLAFTNWESACQRLAPIQSERGRQVVRDMRSMLRPLANRQIAPVKRLLALADGVAPQAGH
jgi:hypothetical protein